MADLPSHSVSSSSAIENPTPEDVSQQKNLGGFPLIALSSKACFRDDLGSRSPTPPSSSRSKARSPTSGDTMSPQEELLSALIENDLPKFERIAANEKVNKYYRYPDPYHGTALELACRKEGRGEFVRVLLQYVKPNVRQINPEPIHIAAQRGYDDALSVLLSDKRTKVFALNSKGQTALHLACLHFSPERVDEYGRCLELLVPKMSVADINKPDCNGFTPFHALVRGRDKKPVEKKSPESLYASSEAGEDRTRGVTASSSFDDSQARERLARLFLRLSQGALDVDSERAKGRSAREDVELRFPQLRELLPERRDLTRRADPYQTLMNVLRNGNIELFSALLQETDPDGNPTLDPNHAYDYPLHTSCLEMACQRSGGEAFVQVLLEAGADPNVPNKLNEKYPIHVACERGHFKELEALFKYSKVSVDVNCEDRFGNTPLHSAVDRISDDRRKETGRRRCLEILLNQPQLDITKLNNAGFTAFRLLVEDENKAAIISFLKAKTNIRKTDLQSLISGNLNSIALYNLISERFSELEPLLQRPVSVDTLHLRREKSKKLFSLLNPSREEVFVQQLRHAKLRDLSKINDNKFTMLQRAARYGLVNAVRALLEANVDPNETFNGNLSPPGVIASAYGHRTVLKILVDFPAFKINATDSKGNTALFYAAKAEENLETVVLLLKHGADMSIRNNVGKLPFSKEQVKSLLDQCVKTNGKNALDEDYELIIDYRLIAPSIICNKELNCRYIQVNCGEGSEITHVESCSNNREKLGSEMELLNMMSKNPELCDLLEHPVVLSFLQFKWIRLKYLSYCNLTVFILFVIFINIFIIMVTKIITNPSKNNNSRSYTSVYAMDTTIPVAIVTLLFWMLLAIREFSQCLLEPIKYFKSLENYLDWSVLVSSMLSLLLPFAGVMAIVVKITNTFTILFSCIALLILLGRVSKFAKYIEMLKVVIYNYILPLLSYSIILVAFGLSFYTLCYESYLNKYIHNQTNCSGERAHDFGSWDMSIVMTLVMMIGELEFKSLPDTSPQTIILFILFVLLVTVVLLNLLTGLAVSDTAKIEAAAHQLGLQSRVGVVLRSERTLVSLYNSDCVAMHVLPLRQLRVHLRRALLFDDSLAGREGRVKTNLSGEVMLCGGGGGAGQTLRMDSVVERAKQIISQRSADPASRSLTLADVNDCVQEVLKIVKMLEVRCGLLVQHEGREALNSCVSVFSDDDWNANPVIPIVDDTNL